MASLVSLKDTKELLRVYHNDDDASLEILIEACSDLIIDYLGARAAEYLEFDSSDQFIEDSEVPKTISVATIIWVGHIYRNPDNNMEGEFQHGMPPVMVTSLLYPFRTPVIG